MSHETSVSYAISVTSCIRDQGVEKQARDDFSCLICYIDTMVSVKISSSLEAKNRSSIRRTVILVIWQVGMHIF